MVGAKWQADHKERSRAMGRLGRRDGAPMGFDEFLDEGKSETAPAARSGAVVVETDKTTPAAGPGARMIAFVAGTKGTYHYLCPMPGHAQMGMAGILIVE